MDSEQGRWEPIDEEYWGRVNVEHKGTVVTAYLNADLERDNGYLIVPLPDGHKVCRWQPGEPGQQSLIPAAQAALGWIDDIYPPNIFDGSSGDPGPVQIVEIRENLRTALKGSQPGQQAQLPDADTVYVVMEWIDGVTRVPVDVFGSRRAAQRIVNSFRDVVEVKVDRPLLDAQPSEQEVSDE